MPFVGSSGGSTRTGRRAAPRCRSAETAVRVRLGARAFATQPLETPDDPEQCGRDRVPAPGGHADVRERLPPLGLRRARADASASSPRSGATTCAGATRSSSSGSPRPRRMSTGRARRGCRSTTPRAEGAVRMVEIGGRRIGLYRVGDELHALADRCPHRGAPLCAGRVATPIDTGERRARGRHDARHRPLPLAQVGVRDRHRRLSSTAGCACAATRCRSRAKRWSCRSTCRPDSTA